MYFNLHKTFAELARAAYHQGGKSSEGLPTGWRVLEEAYPQDNQGVGCATYINDLDKETKEHIIVVAVRGTDFGRKDDLLNDLRLALGGIPNGSLTVNQQAHKAKTEHREKFSEILVDSLNVVGGVTGAISGGMPFSASILLFLMKNISSYLKEKFTGLVQFLNRTSNANIPQVAPTLPTDEKKEMDAGIEKLRKEHKGYEVFIVGHSLGGAIAELIGSLLKIPTITFDSPGSAELLSAQHGYDATFVANNFIHYLSAPNLVNTLYQHKGRGYRLFIPYTDGRTSWKFIADCALGSTKRALGLGTAAASIYGTGGLGTPAGLTVASTIASEGSNLYDDTTYLLRQHSIENIIKSFPPAKPIAEIKLWPHRGAKGVAFEKAKDIGKGLIPFKWSNKGLHTLFFSKEDEVIEAKINEMGCKYEVVEWGKLLAIKQPLTNINNDTDGQQNSTGEHAVPKHQS